MQFKPATFAQFATSADHRGKPSIYNPADAIYTAAAMLCADGAASGTTAGIRQAIFAYNRSRLIAFDADQAGRCAPLTHITCSPHGRTRPARSSSPRAKTQLRYCATTGRPLWPHCWPVTPGH